ncbi:hypothetical protein [Duganella sp. Root1480D1]|uniref:hypothetical protein n=1 Tax=Duganella sp. Root1480D1 TaxID=1736471 RepID=UPI000710D79F|nr:hypothetical protein [Duganella sp. Root1480D1]KQZ44002.1 hypothetical protein ASD58_19845 [Duganella sp. Root1480D1]
MWQWVRAHLSGYWPVYRLGLAGMVCIVVLWGAFMLVQQNLESIGLGAVDPKIFALVGMFSVFACYGHFAKRIIREVKKKQGRVE